MADQYEASMFGLDSPYWKDKYGWDFQRDERYPEKLDDLQENRLLAEGLNMAGITPDMGLGDIRKKYKSEFEGLSNEEIHSFLNDVLMKSGVGTEFTYGDANSMFRKFLNLQGILREPGKKDWPTIDIPFWRDPVASIDPDIWDEKMLNYKNKFLKATGLDSYEGPIAETIEYEEPQQVGPEGVPSFDDSGITMDMMDLNYDLTPLYQTEYGDSLYPTGYNYNLEGTTTKKLGYTPRYENNAMLQLNAKNAFIQLQQKFFDLHGKNFELASAYRSEDHDAAVGGKDLNHPKGNAFDVRFSLLSDKEKDDLKILGKTVGLHWANYPGSSHFNYR